MCFQYLCDGAYDCDDGYDEDPKLCTAAKRPPVEETASFLTNLLSTHGVNYLERIFGRRARHGLRLMGGIDRVSIALSGDNIKYQKFSTELKPFIGLEMY